MSSRTNLPIFANMKTCSACSLDLRISIMAGPPRPHVSRHIRPPSRSTLARNLHLYFMKNGGLAWTPSVEKLGAELVSYTFHVDKLRFELDRGKSHASGFLDRNFYVTIYDRSGLPIAHAGDDTPAGTVREKMEQFGEDLAPLVLRHSKRFEIQIIRRSCFTYGYLRK
ncbi:hypothetical protein K461DRAFT_282449 [Myriangium duriaei CBS 260.36]|uniref:Uncharacterized protein n=1 Tax=Myriangium duriaei CBS 260.36 TaxID=1168546 RepID=A0A9P4IY50_9PEZI|nr:hypothetical protein K461DRAFT_282449 [Myriangium duriaei CBS 260.36]